MESQTEPRSERPDDGGFATERRARREMRSDASMPAVLAELRDAVTQLRQEVEQLRRERVDASRRRPGFPRSPRGPGRDRPGAEPRERPVPDQSHDDVGEEEQQLASEFVGDSKDAAHDADLTSEVGMTEPVDGADDVLDLESEGDDEQGEEADEDEHEAKRDRDEATEGDEEDGDEDEKDEEEREGDDEDEEDEDEEEHDYDEEHEPEDEDDEDPETANSDLHDAL